MATDKISELSKNCKDITGQRFGRLIAKQPTNQRQNGHIVWLCTCDCGNMRYVNGNNLCSGNTQSCGCIQEEINRNGGINKKHGMTGTSIYKIWHDMTQRCENRNSQAYKNYGGRGITVSEEFHDFQIWHDHIGPRPDPGYTQDRINNDGNYERGNIRWATRKVQNNNRRPMSCGPHKQYWFRSWHKDSMAQYLNNNQHEFARQHGLRQSCIHNCLNGKQKIYKGWEFQRI